MTVFFTADTHWGHGGALGLYRRPFASVAAMDAALVANWRGVVGAADEIWHLGDVAVGRHIDVGALLAALPGRKHLLVGNNDPAPTVSPSGWASVQAYAEATVDGVDLVLCHYAFRTWRGMAKGALNLHGHSHGRLKPLPRQFDVGVDVWDFHPVTLPQILASAPRSGRPLPPP